MRVWDIHPGYLSRQRLLGEHREIHALCSIIVNGKTGYSHHPETLRWIGKLPALVRRHEWLAEEMLLRGYRHLSPMPPAPGGDTQTVYIDAPARQFLLLREKYRPPEQGRIPLPANLYFLWAHHKYSIMARDPEMYKHIGPLISRNPNPELLESWALKFTETLQITPSPGRLLNALQHMWGYVAQLPGAPSPPESPSELLIAVQHLARAHNIVYLLHSTALSDLALFTR